MNIMKYSGLYNDYPSVARDYAKGIPIPAAKSRISISEWNIIYEICYKWQNI